MKKDLFFAADVEDLTKFFVKYVNEYNTFDYTKRNVSESAIKVALKDYFERNAGRNDLTIDDLVYTMTHKYKFADSIFDVGRDCLAVNWEEENKYAWTETEKMILEREAYIDKILRSGKEWVVCIFENDRLKGAMDWVKTAKAVKVRLNVRNVEVDDCSDTDDSANIKVDFSIGNDKYIYRAFNEDAEVYGELDEVDCGFFNADGKALTYNDVNEGNFDSLVAECKFVKAYRECNKDYYKVVLVDGDRRICDWFVVEESVLFNEILEKYHIRYFSFSL